MVKSPAKPLLLVWSRAILLLTALLWFEFSAAQAISPIAIQGLSQLVQAGNIIAQFEQTISGTKKVQKGTVYLKTPNLFLWEYDNGQKLISNGKNFGIYDPELQQLMMQPLAKMNNQLQFLSTGKSWPEFLKEYRLKAFESKEDNLFWVELQGEGDQATRIGFDKNSDLKQLRYEDYLNNPIWLYFKNVRLKEKISPSKFSFQVPKGTEVVWLKYENDQ